MPTYQYACTECGEQLEVVQKFSDEPLTVCPQCQGRLRKVFSPVGVVFKGSGFYKTDSRSKAAASSGASSSDGTKSPGSGPDKSTEKSTEKSAEKSSDTSGSPTASSDSKSSSGSSSGDGSKVA
jgi:putative FmdB family regulatory protein